MDASPSKDNASCRKFPHNEASGNDGAVGASPLSLQRERERESIIRSMCSTWILELETSCMWIGIWESDAGTCKYRPASGPGVPSAYTGVVSKPCLGLPCHNLISARSAGHTIRRAYVLRQGCQSLSGTNRSASSSVG